MQGRCDVLKSYFAKNNWQLTWRNFEELAETFNGFNAMVSKTFYGKVCNVCYCNVSYILSLKVHEKTKNENCIIKFIFKEWFFLW